MAVSPIGSGFSVYGVYGVNNRNISPIQKIADLKKQRTEAEEKLRYNNSPELNNRIKTLDKQIRNLEVRQSKAVGKEECQTCKNRKYKDESDDPGVSFKTAAKIDPQSAASTVLRHEYEHVNRNIAKASREGTKVVSQSVRLKKAICPECGKAYVAGGETRTVTKKSVAEKFNVGIPDASKEKGKYLNCVA